MTNKKEDDENGGTGTSGEIEFRYRDILSSDLRDDILPDSEIRRLLSVHEDLHKRMVDDQKNERKHRDDIKNGRVETKEYDSLGLRVGQGGGGGGGGYEFKSHPISNHAQFSGATDRKVTGVPSDSNSKTNEGDKNKLVNDLTLTLTNDLKLQNAPTYTSTPTLTRR